MNNTVVIYKSKYGSTKRYAEWISQELNCELLENSKIKPELLNKYDTVIYGGGIYAGNILGVSLIIKNFDILKNKKLAIFTVGFGNPAETTTIDNIYENINKVFTPEIKSKITFFHLRGAMDFTKLSFFHKLIMSMLKKMLKKNADTDEQNKSLIEACEKGADFVDKQTIKPIVEFAKN